MTPGDTGSVPVHIRSRTPVARDEDQHRSTIPIPTFARRPSAINSLFPVDIPQNSMVGQQRQQISELQFDKFPTPPAFLCWKIRFKSQATICSDFPSEAMLWIKEVEMLGSSEELKSSPIRFWKEFSKFWDAGPRKLLLLWTRSSKTLTSRRRSVSRTRKPRKKIGFSEDDRLPYMIYDYYFRVTGAHDTVLDYADVFSVTLRDDNIQEFDSRWDEVLPSMSMIPSDDVLESLYISRIRVWSTQNLIRIVRHGNQSKDIDAQLSEIENGKWRSETSVANFGSQTRENRIRSRGQESKGFEWRWKRKRCMLPVERKKGQCSKGDKCSFRPEGNDRAKPTPKAAPPSDPQSSKTRGRSVSRKRNARGRSQSEKFHRPLCKKYLLKCTCTKLPCEYWDVKFYKPILPNVNSIKIDRDVSLAQSAHSRTGRLKNKQTKRRKRVMTKVQLLFRKSVRQLSCVPRDTEPPDFKEGHKKCWNQLDEYDSRGLHCVKQTSEKINVRRLVKYKSEFLISEDPTQKKLRTDLQKDCKTRAMCLRRCVGTCQTKILSSKGKTKLHSIRLLRSGFCRPHQQWTPRKKVCGRFRSKQAHGGKHSTTMQIGIIPRFWFCRWPGRFKINIGWNLMHFRKSNIYANKLDVQETDINFSQSDRDWDNFSWCGMDCIPALYLWNLVKEVFHEKETWKHKQSEEQSTLRHGWTSVM